MITVLIPGALRELAGNRAEVRVEAGAGPLGATLAQLWVACPGIRDRVTDERGRVRPHVNVFVDGENIRYTGGLDTPVRDGAEILPDPRGQRRVTASRRATPSAGAGAAPRPRLPSPPGRPGTAP